MNINSMTTYLPALTQSSVVGAATPRNAALMAPERASPDGPEVNSATANKTLNEISDAQPSDAVRDAVNAINRFLSPTDNGIEFSVDEESGRTLVKVIDKVTLNVLRQFPSQEALDMSHMLEKLQGLLVRVKA